jgi:hypothetical protein
MQALLLPLRRMWALLLSAHHSILRLPLWWALLLSAHHSILRLHLVGVWAMSPQKHHTVFLLSMWRVMGMLLLSHHTILPLLRQLQRVARALHLSEAPSIRATHPPTALSTQPAKVLEPSVLLVAPRGTSLASQNGA